VARGLAGAVLLAVPVAVAAFIGFGTSISGVVGGLTEIATGPDRAPAAQTTPGSSLTSAQVALTAAPTGGGGGAGGAGGKGGGGGVVGGGGGSTGGGTGDGSSGGSNSGSSTGSPAPVNPPSVDVNNTGVGDAVNSITNSVGQLLPNGGH
jgi:hypothetical protein